MGNVPDHRGSLAILPPEDAREGDAAPWILVPQPQPAGIVREVDCTVLLHDKIIGAVELLAIEPIGQRDRLPFFSIRLLPRPAQVAITRRPSRSSASPFDPIMANSS